MTKGQKAKRQLALDLVNCYNLEADRWGHFVFTATNGRVYRMKFQRASVRFESKYGKTWHKLVTRTYLQTCVSDYSQYLAGATQ